MTDKTAGTRAEWLSARLTLLEAEKDLTRRGDELARRRRELPWVRLEKEYVFETERGEKTLRELFGGRSQLLVYHFMFGPDWTEGCPACSFWADGFDRSIVHLNHRDVTMLCSSRAPLARLDAYKRRMGWSFEWVSSLQSDFNYDFGVSFPEDRRTDGTTYNFKTQDSLSEEHPGLSAFALENGAVYHTYSCYARGLDAFNTAYQLLDRAPKGRDETNLPEPWLRRHDEYA
ncbi:MAG: DUF899 domain-containing protein [Candidatus Dormibacteraeota bacterium]|nr:DUF899 domain-containing protein [Candidatus Dormibacteraeota bacterium]